ncbi:hypothetical protein [Oceanicaulis sp.]|uniref:hypothetical protein n=1 Tax=Oceanicaulis sp. TaxID=1924941 RepID=UPI003F6F955E
MADDKDFHRLVTVLEANIAKHEKAMNKALGQASTTARGISTEFRRSSQQVNRHFDAMRNTARNAFGAVAAYMSTRAVTQFVQGSLQAAESIADMGRQANASTEELQALRHVVDQNGGSADLADRALRRMSSVMGDVMTGAVDEATRALERMELAERIRNGEIRTSDQLFTAMVEKLETVEDANIRASLTADVLGRRMGEELGQSLSIGREQLERTRQAARDMGLVLSDELVQQGSAANATMRALQQSMAAEAQGEVLRYSNELLSVAEALGEIAKWGIRATAALPQFGQWLGGELAGINGVSGQSAPAERERANEDVLRRIREQRYNGDGISRGVVRDWIEDAGFSDNFRDSFMEAFGNGPTTLPGGMGFLTEGALDRLETVLQLAVDRAKLDARAAEASANRSDLPVSIVPSTPAAGGGGAAGGEADPRRLSPLSETRVVGLPSLDERRARIEAYFGDRSDMALPDGAEIAQGLQDAVSDNREAWASEFGWMMATGAQQAWDGDVMQYGAKVLSNAMQRQLSSVFTELGRQLFDMLSQMEGGFGGLVAKGAQFLFGGFRAEGGDVRPGMSYRVGERGPERFVPDVPGRIVPEYATRQMQAPAVMGGGDIRVRLEVDEGAMFAVRVAEISTPIAQRTSVDIVSKQEEARAQGQHEKAKVLRGGGR